MPLGEVLRNKEELLSQYRVLGVSTESELRNSDNVVYVQAYTKEDGTEVKAHWRSKPDGVENNNLSINSSAQSGKSTGGASELENDLKYSDITTGEPIVDVSTPEKIQKLMYPDEIAGVKRGKPKTFEQMMQMGVNPKYMSEEDTDGEYSKNCQLCVIAAELIIRGYDVEAVGASNPISKELRPSNVTVYLDPMTGKSCVPDIILTNEISCYDYLDKNVKVGQRYELSFNTPTESGNSDYDKEHENDGHVVIITRDEDGKLKYYDPQQYDYHEGEDIKDFLTSWFQYKTPVIAPKILRIDDKLLNPKYINAVVKSRAAY